MRTTVELPDDLLRNAKTKAAAAGLSLREFFIEAVEQKLATGEKRRIRQAVSAEGQAVPTATTGWDEFFDLLGTVDVPSDFMNHRPLNAPPNRRGVLDS